MSDSILPRSAKKQATREWSIAALVSLVVSLAIIAPFFRLGTASGHDVAFHMASWLDAAGQWRQGILFPRWTEWANFGFGEPRFIFYPPLSWMFGALLGTILPWQAVAATFCVLVQTFAGLSAFALLRSLAAPLPSAIVAAACFVANPYALLIIYMRSDFAELLAIAFFPLLILSALKLAKDKDRIAANAVRFACCFSAVWLSNAPAAVIATYSVTLLFATAALRARSIRPAVRGAAGMLAGFCFAAFYLVPAIYEQRWVNITGVLAEGLTPADNFLFARTSDSEHDAFNLIASRIALLLIAWAVLAGVAAWRTGKATGGNTWDRMLLNVIAASATLLMLPITQILWRLLPELRFVQFPWRWMSVLAACSVALMVLSMRGQSRWIWAAAMGMTLAVTGYFLVRNAWWDTEDMPTLRAAIRSGAGFEGTDEYDPTGDDHSELTVQQPRVAILAAVDGGTRIEAKVEVEKWDAEHRFVRVHTTRAAKLALRLVSYPAWKLTVNGKTAHPQAPKKTAQVIVTIPEGESEIRADFTRTPDRTLGGWISGLSWLAAALCLAVRRRAATALEA
jgi:hypothetical protein